MNHQAGDETGADRGPGLAPHTPRPLGDLLRQSARGDQQAFAEFYDLSVDRVHGLILRTIRSPEMAAEITQEVYVEVWRTSSRFDPVKGPALAWVCTLAHRRAVDRIRQVEREREREQRWSREDVRPETDDTWAATELSLDAHRVRQELGRLTDLQREAVSLAYYGGYTQSEVATLLDVPLGTVKTRLRDALGRLRDALGVNR